MSANTVETRTPLVRESWGHPGRMRRANRATLILPKPDLFDIAPLYFVAKLVVELGCAGIAVGSDALNNF